VPVLPLPFGPVPISRAFQRNRNASGGVLAAPVTVLFSARGVASQVIGTSEQTIMAGSLTTMPYLVVGKW
jgi:hypothetical protein